MPDTEEKLMFKRAFAQVGPVHWGPNTGSTAIVFSDDYKNMEYESKYKKSKGH